ncbi:heavy metal-associated domain-containing protein [Thermosulfurimonas sp.]|uniref:heavy-metal-associated domain-containing protein n=1 Tax=Thermosulfurimonas sp. TaxID=2080236 RepID=UPI0025CBD949|nr:heavy metal-associated domain-containing protein [Thermosulfurimonas sp.]
MSRITLKIAGMSCEHCVQRVTRALSALPGVKEVKVDLTTGTATLEKPEELPREEIVRAVEEAGYRVEE